MLLMKNRVAAAAISAYSLLKAGGTAGTVVPTTAASDKVIGVATDVDSTSGERIDVILLGEGKAVAGAAFADGDLLMSDASGRVVVAAATAGANVRIVGQAREAATAAGDIVEITVLPGMFQG